MRDGNGSSSTVLVELIGSGISGEKPGSVYTWIRCLPGISGVHDNTGARLICSAPLVGAIRLGAIEKVAIGRNTGQLPSTQAVAANGAGRGEPNAEAIDSRVSSRTRLSATGRIVTRRITVLQ